RLDETPPKGSLAQFLHINWLPPNREHEYPKLLEACQPTVEATPAVEDVPTEEVPERALNLHRGADSCCAYAVHAIGKHCLVACTDSKVLFVDIEIGRTLRVLEGHLGIVHCVAWSPDGRRALSGATDGTVRLWDVESGRCLRVLEGHSGSVLSVAW